MIEPLRHNPQTQPITVALKNICRDYPAGGGVLRELLQNADDAGASSVSFVLDQTSYPTATLVHSDLAEYQGPSLLAYNDATFSEQDFYSLSRIGDSRKVQDGTTTGRFGRGFNAVYNWTDSPSIVSRNGLLILDPHHSWSKCFDNPGGPLYDFVANAEGGEMADQMAAFSTLTQEFDREFPGTIIRIPLRTSKQAKKSEICTREAPYSEVAQVLETFAQDFGHTGLLFLKNISHISIRVGDKPPIKICISNDEQVRKYKSEINDVIKKTISEDGISLNSSFEVQIESGTLNEEHQYRFAVHHIVQNYPNDESLKSWGKDEALVPWVAVASEIGSNPAGGSLFNVLPSQIRINQPILIHSCFSMSPDRARLHKMGDSGVQYPLAGRWNRWLFDDLIPTAWANLLVYLAQQYPDQSAFHMWPWPQEDSNDISYNIDKRVMQIIQQNDFRVWYSDLGYIKLGSGLFAQFQTPSILRKAIKEADVPIIYLPDALRSRVETTCKVEHLKPQTLCNRLKPNQEQLRTVNEDGKKALLDYLISDPKFRGYGAVELFPFEDGTYRAIENEPAFVHHDENERLLFQLEQSRNIDLQKLSTSTMQAIQKRCSTSSLHSSLRRRSTYDLKTYSLRNYFIKIDSTKDLIFVDENTSTFISKVWDWIVTRRHSILDDNISCLWLLPLTNNGYRKIKPMHTSSDTIYATPGKLGDFLKSFASITHASNKPIVKANDLSPHSLQLLVGAMGKNPSLMIKSSDRIENFMLWLGKIREVFNIASDNDRRYLHKILASYIPTGKDRKAIADVLRCLKIFERVVWTAKNDHMVIQRTWVTLNEHSEFIGLRELDPIPDLGGVAFLDARSEETERLLNFFELAKFPSTLKLLERFMVPFWEDENMLRKWTTSGKERITESLLRDFYNLNGESRKRIVASAIIPVKRFDGLHMGKFSMASELIDPSSTRLRLLFFDDEEACPTNWVLEKYSGILIDCGLRTALDEDLVVDRAKCFAQRSEQFEETLERTYRLLQSSPSWGLGSDERGKSTLRELRWLPVIDLQGSLVYKNAKECRPKDEKLLVGYVLPTLAWGISQVWQSHLGWSQPIVPDTLIKQLEHGIEKGDRKVVDAVLKYVNEKGQIEDVRQALSKLRCVVASNGQLVYVEKTFKSGCEELQPYLYNVENFFWSEHSQLLHRLCIREKPDLQDLLRIQDQLPSEDELHESQIPVAIGISKLACAFPRSQLSSLKILDETGRLRPIEDITFNDLGSSVVTGTFNSTHPDIPKWAIKELKIEPLSSRVRKGELGIEDANDDEFDQHEEVPNAISDTLTRYKVESTFKEFLANADDCGAKELNWLLDEKVYPAARLLTEELKKFQGPALLVHNDKVFTEEHFEGLRSVGQGSKGYDATTIGKFGRGSQTMYHWTDVPMLLSGKYLVILDPLRQSLDYNYRTLRRKPGVKIELSRLKGAYRDQLAPFEGLWGFSIESDYYPETIFRFPLRQLNAQSKLVKTRTRMDFKATRKCLDDFLEQEGRMSLLFLRNTQYMDFKIRGNEKPRWSIESEKEWSFSGWTKCTITRCMNQTLDGTFKERWRVAIEDLRNVCTELPARHKEKMKNIECGIAAFVPEPNLKQKPIFKADPVPRYFSHLPLPFTTDLPVHIHASFLLASDRASMPVEDSMQEDGAKWNRWLLSHAIPDLYLAFLEDLSRETRWVKDPFPFWPQAAPPIRHFSELVFTSFWQMLPQSSRGLFPVATQIRAARLEERRPPELVRLDEAVFDFLPTGKSRSVAAVLESQIPKLVRPPPKIKQQLQQGMLVESVTPKRLRELFKDENASKFLEEEASENNRALTAILELIIPTQDEDFTELDGCRILPLADGILGTLRFAGSSNPAEQFFLATEEELKIFHFALGRLTGDLPGADFKKKILDGAKFNLTRLDLSHIGKLLERQEFGDKIPTAEMDTWLNEFWDYCHLAETSSMKTEMPFTSSLEIRRYPIFKATCDGVSSYIEPEKLDALPSVIEPDKPEHRSLCNRFPGIHIFGSSYLPRDLRTAEACLDNKASFVRFINSISRLASNENMELDVYVQKYLEIADIKLLQKLVVNYVTRNPSIKKDNLRYLLRSLPVWPTTESSTWISITAGRATATLGLMIPWMIGYSQFIEYEYFIRNSSAMRALGVHEVPGIELLLTHIIPKLPARLSDVDTYRTFIKAIPKIPNWKSALNNLRQIRLAPNRAKSLTYASVLFDHEDSIFTSAFRNEADILFLLKEFEESKTFWLDLGLKHRTNGQFEPYDYILCLEKIRDRLEACTDLISNSIVSNDAEKVLEPLTAPSIALNRCSEQHWRLIADRATFPVMRGFYWQPAHRREAMALVAEATPLLQLSEIIQSQYLSVCWSQISFPKLDPSVTTFSKLDSKGKPPTAMVWRHLEHLSDSIEGLSENEVEDFLSDIYNTYNYLQENMGDIRNSFNDFRRKRIWFNLELTDNKLVRKADLETYRCAIQNLILESSCDTQNLQSVRQGLIPYQRLLRALGCKSIVYPSVEPAQNRDHELIYTSLGRLRREGKLLDVKLEAIDGSIQTHRVVIAAASTYFATQFNGNWSNNDTIDLTSFSRSTLSTVVDFAYSDANTFDWSSMQVAENERDNTDAIEDRLNELLDLLEAANYLDMPDLKAQVEDQILVLPKLFIREPNVLGVWKRASEARAARVERYCERFYEDNKEAVDLAVEGEEEGEEGEEGEEEGEEEWGFE